MLTVENMYSNHYFSFVLHEFFERKTFLESTWCELCDVAYLAIFTENEFEIDGSKSISDHCRKCAPKILSEFIEKNIEKRTVERKEFGDLNDI